MPNSCTTRENTRARSERRTLRHRIPRAPGLQAHSHWCRTRARAQTASICLRRTAVDGSRKRTATFFRQVDSVLARDLDDYPWRIEQPIPVVLPKPDVLREVFGDARTD